ncbi:TetR family transcriptional regulator C-terminal domain-containing protein [Streptomyces adelaidensis]|uniref:TetR family transcriptional regulator C-terminal domain-containing protein n=1 Tax=Streptomyces adelaidensis TaxID=2796465 RepID=UPI0019037145|nr:TetR family transcriptional regulator C-terminal domain-containing protein [Streptomyces adelaidensis]
MTRTLNALFVTLNQNVLRELLGGMEETAARDMALFLAGGVGAVVNDWLIEGAEPLDPEELAGRLLHLESALASMPRIRDDGESTR